MNIEVRLKQKSHVRDKNGFYYGIQDLIFRNVLLYIDILVTKEYLAYLLNININDIKDIKIENPTLEVFSKREKSKNLDILLLINRNIYVNIEMNSSYYTTLHARNLSYIAGVYSQKWLTRGKEYKDDDVKSFYHIDLTCGLPKVLKDGICKSMYIQNDKSIKYIQKFVIFEFDMDSIMELWYNQNMEGIRNNYLLIALRLDKNDLKKLSNHQALNKHQKYIVRKIRRMVMKMNDEEFWSRMPSYEEKKEEEAYLIMLDRKKEAHDAGLAEGRAKGRAEGRAQGFKEGKKQSNIENIERMARNNLEPSLIAKYLGLPISKVKKVLSNTVL